MRPLLVQILEGTAAGENGRYRQRQPIAINTQAQPHLRGCVQFTDHRIQLAALLVGIVGLAPKGRHVAVGMQIADDVRLTAAGRQDAGGGGVLGQFLHLHRPSLVVEPVENFIQPVVGPAANRPPGAAGVRQNPGQQRLRNRGRLQPEVRRQRRQPAHQAGRNGKVRLRKTGFRPNEKAAACQDILIAQTCPESIEGALLAGSGFCR